MGGIVVFKDSNGKFQTKIGPQGLFCGCKKGRSKKSVLQASPQENRAPKSRAPKSRAPKSRAPKSRGHLQGF